MTWGQDYFQQLLFKRHSKKSLDIQDIQKATEAYVLNDWQWLIFRHNELCKHFCYLYVYVC